MRSDRATGDARFRVMEYLATDGVLGGIENHVLLLCERLDRATVSPAIVWATDQGGQGVVDRARVLEVPIYRFRGRGKDRQSYAERTVRLARLLRRERTDLLHVHACGFTGANAFVAARLARVPGVVVTHHLWFGPRPHTAGARLAWALEKRTAGRVIGLYAGQARELAEAGFPAGKIAVVPNGVDLRRFRCRREGPRREHKTLDLIIVARMVQGKGHRELVQAIGQLADREGIHLTVVGDGPTRQGVEAEVQARGLSGAVRLIGAVPNERVPELLGEADVIVLPSYFPGETFPIALLEGMAMGCAAIGTNWAGIPDMIVDGVTGLLIEPRDVAGLARAVAKLRGEQGLAAAMGERARLNVKENFSAAALGRRVETVYAEALAVACPRTERTWKGDPGKRLAGASPHD